MLNMDQRAGLLRQLHALNRSFIDTLLSGKTTPRPALCVERMLQLSALDPAALHALCAAPFTLYYLPFDDPPYWREAQLAPAISVRMVEAAPAQAITQLTLFLAWHTAHVDPASARSFFGMAFGTLRFFQTADVATLNAVTAHAACVLEPRWPTHPFFWSDLLQHAAGDRVRLHATHLLGAQLLAADLSGEFTRVTAAPKLTGALQQPRETAALDAVADAPNSLGSVLPI